MRKCNKRKANLFALALATVPAAAGFAATSYTWITPLFGVGTGNDDWSTPGNWSPTGVPGTGDSAFVPGDGLFGGSVLYDYAGPSVTLSVVNISANPSGRTTPVSLLNISANNLSANNEYVGDSGSSTDGQGEINQSGGTNSISGLFNSTLYLAYNQSDSGAYNLSGSAILTATNLVVGYNGTATFTQTGGTGNYGQLVVNQSYGTGTYNLSGNGVINATGETIGENGSGSGGATFLQLGGVNSGGGIAVGIQGTGTYTQIGGATVAPNGLSVGDNQAAGSGTFNLEAGTLNSGAVNVGAVGLGIFNHSGGTYIATSLTLGAAGYEEEVSGEGQYYLSGSGTLIVTGFEAIAGDGSGEFTQTGGTNTDDGNMVIPEPSYTGSANYSLSGGSASANGTQIGTEINSSTARGTLAVTGNGTFTDPLGINLQTRGTLSLGGGTINTASVQMSGGTFAWTSGTLNITGAAGLTIDTGDLLGAVASITPGEILDVTTTLTNNGTFTNTSHVSAGNVVNVGTFTSEATLAVAGSFMNSGTAILGGTQNWAHGATFFNTAGAAAFQTDAGSASSSTLAVNLSSGNVTLASPQHWAGLTITGGILDISNEHLFLSYGSSDPISTIYSYLKAGCAGGTWAGATGITSFTAAASGGRYGVGFADGKDGVVAGLSSGQIEVKYTLLGDANLDGTVNGTDFSILAANFGLGETNWDQGNFLYGSSVNGSDFSALAGNFGQGDSGADAAVSQSDIVALDAFAVANDLPLPTIGSVPEPAAAGLVVLSTMVCLASRRKTLARPKAVSPSGIVSNH
jgi:hypothetical protein